MTSSVRLGADRHFPARPIPDTAVSSLHELTTADGAKVTGVLRTIPGARTVVCLMHPRQDFTHHVLVPELLARGMAVWTQGTRSVNNDLNLLHEQAVLDMAAGQVFLRNSPFDHVVTLGHSGGGTLAALYHQQSGLPPGRRISRTPAGRPVDLAGADLPVPDAAVFMAPHLGQGVLLERLIDPSVTHETDPLSVDPELDPYSAANGFADAPQSSTYTPEFVAHYRAAQRARIERIDAHARELAAEATAARQRFKRSADVADRRRALAPRIITVYRTDADLRGTDQTLDANERPYGSLFGSRPDLINYGLLGFGRLSTPEAWLSTWSAVSTHADFLRCAPGIGAPTLLVELTGDQAAFPPDSAAMMKSFGSGDATHRSVRGLHFGGPLSPGEPAGSSLAADVIGAWTAERFPLAD
ncbi:hypothetical protein ACIQNU_09330 [Streptomyces sp. NPDC091292]|uniref:hypothetical protein n=1 Tax=Streptomyces sp. NPDC091292 TaxID=3365991 RepID=UPI003822ECCA